MNTDFHTEYAYSDLRYCALYAYYYGFALNGSPLLAPIASEPDPIQVVEARKKSSKTCLETDEVTKL